MGDYLSTYKSSGADGWVIFFDTEEGMGVAARGLAEAGVSSEMRRSEKADYPYWLAVGIPSNEVDDIAMPLLEGGQLKFGRESEFVPYSDVAAGSELLMTVNPEPVMTDEERARHEEKLKREREQDLWLAEEERRMAEAALAEEARRNQIKAEREREKVCIMCGTPLGALQKLFAAKAHKNCTLFTEERSYVDNGDGTVTDKATGLMWTKKAAYGRMKWGKAVKYCNKFKFAGYSDWRLPGVSRHGGRAELDTLFRKGGSPIGEWEGAGGTPFTGVQYGGYWAGSPFAHDEDFAWYVNMANGGAYFYNKNYYGYVWPVRGGPQEAAEPGT